MGAKGSRSSATSHTNSGKLCVDYEGMNVPDSHAGLAVDLPLAS